MWNCWNVIIHAINWELSCSEIWLVQELTLGHVISEPVLFLLSWFQLFGSIKGVNQIWKTYIKKLFMIIKISQIFKTNNVKVLLKTSLMKIKCTQIFKTRILKQYFIWLWWCPSIISIHNSLLNVCLHGSITSFGSIKKILNLETDFITTLMFCFWRTLFSFSVAPTICGRTAERLNFFL